MPADETDGILWLAQRSGHTLLHALSITPVSPSPHSASLKPQLFYELSAPYPYHPLTLLLHARLPYTNTNLAFALFILHILPTRKGARSWDARLENGMPINADSNCMIPTNRIFISAENYNIPNTKTWRTSLALAFMHSKFVFQKIWKERYKSNVKLSSMKKTLYSGHESQSHCL